MTNESEEKLKEIAIQAAKESLRDVLKKLKNTKKSFQYEDEKKTKEMKHKHWPAFPVPENAQNTGISVRIWVATHLCGFVMALGEGKASLGDITRDSVLAADALLNELGND